VSAGQIRETAKKFREFCRRNRERGRKMIRNIIFDVGYVLIGYSWKEQFLRFGYSAKALARLAQAMFGEGVRDGSRLLWEKYDCGEISDGEIRAECLARYPEDRQALEWFFDNPSDWAVLLSDMADLIPLLKEKGYRVYLLSNYPERLWKCHVTVQPFYSRTDGETVSYAEHCQKPEKRFFQILLDRYGLRPEECLFLDDRADNTHQAEALGIEAITLDSPAARIAAADRLLKMEAVPADI
jgi:putative hydrolase of the HAD superfamily